MGNENVVFDNNQNILHLYVTKKKKKKIIRWTWYCNWTIRWQVWCRAHDKKEKRENKNEIEMMKYEEALDVRLKEEKYHLCVI